MDCLRICDYMNAKVVDVKFKRLFKPTMVVQAIFTFADLILGIITIFDNKLLNVFLGIMAATLLIMAYNNTKFFKKKNLNYLYIIFATYLIISIIIDIW